MSFREIRLVQKGVAQQILGTLQYTARVEQLAQVVARVGFSWIERQCRFVGRRGAIDIAPITGKLGYVVARYQGGWMLRAENPDACRQHFLQFGAGRPEVAELSQRVGGIVATGQGVSVLRPERLRSRVARRTEEFVRFVDRAGITQDAGQIVLGGLRVRVGRAKHA